MTEASQAGALTELYLDEDKVHKSLVPDDVVIRDYLSCINDDTWVRHADLVQIKNLKETPVGEEAKQEVLRTFIDERATKGIQRAPDPILEGIVWQERFMEEYKKDQRSQDKKDAGNYKQTLLKSFRSKNPASRCITSGTTASYSANNAIEYRPGPESPKAAATEFKREEKQSSPKAPPAAAAASLYPTDGAAENVHSAVPPDDVAAAPYEIDEAEANEMFPLELKPSYEAAEIETTKLTEPVTSGTKDPSPENAQFGTELDESAAMPTGNSASKENYEEEM